MWHLFIVKVTIKLDSQNQNPNFWAEALETAM
jgi:hypothetical protein